MRDVVYVGNMGLSMALDVVIDAAARLRDDPTIRFVHDRRRLGAARLRARAAAAGLTNVVFTGPLPRADAARALADAAATVVPLVATITDTLPTKLFDAMLAGTPIVLSAAGEAQRRRRARRRRARRRRRRSGRARGRACGGCSAMPRCARASRERTAVRARELRPRGGDDRVRRARARAQLAVERGVAARLRRDVELVARERARRGRARARAAAGSSSTARSAPPPPRR